MQPKIVVILVLGTPKHLELSLILQNWPFARPPKFENAHYRVKIQNCCRPMAWPIKTCARRALSQWKKNYLNRTYQLGEKSPKPPKNTLFRKVTFRVVFWIFLLSNSFWIFPILLTICDNGQTKLMQHTYFKRTIMWNWKLFQLRCSANMIWPQQNVQHEKGKRAAI